MHLSTIGIKCDEICSWHICDTGSVIYVCGGKSRIKNKFLYGFFKHNIFKFSSMTHFIIKIDFLHDLFRWKLMKFLSKYFHIKSINHCNCMEFLIAAIVLQLECLMINLFMCVDCWTELWVVQMQIFICSIKQ